MKKSFLFFSAACCLVGVLACGSGGDPDGNSPSPDPSPTESTDCTITLQTDSWEVLYDGYGEVILDEENGFLLEPEAVSDPNETKAALVTSINPAGCDFQDFRLTVVVTTEEQLRTPTPNGWEVFWIFFNYQPEENLEKTTNYFIYKPNGIELGRAFDSIGQYFLFTDSEPTLTIGESNEFVLEKVGGNLTVWIDGTQVLNYSSTTLPDALYDQPGSIGLYTEDARVVIESVLLESLD